MPTKGSVLAQTSSAVALAHRRRDPAAIAAARREHAAAKLAEFVERVVADAPPLTDEQIDRITSLLGGAK